MDTFSPFVFRYGTAADENARPASSLFDFTPNAPVCQSFFQNKSATRSYFSYFFDIQKATSSIFLGKPLSKYTKATPAFAKKYPFCLTFLLFYGILFTMRAYIKNNMQKAETPACLHDFLQSEEKMKKKFII